jgi:glutathione S-transferase
MKFLACAPATTVRRSYVPQVEEIVLHQPPLRSWGTPNLSPFCAKLECYLRMADIPYKPGGLHIRKAPKGKIPFVYMNGGYMGDSQLIIEELERRLASEGKPTLDAGLSAHDIAYARLLRRALEEGFYFVGLYARWRPDDAYAVMRDEFKKMVPAIALPIVRRAQKQKLQRQGTGRHSYDEAMAIGCADIDALAELLGERPFMLGDQPRTLDCTVFAFLEASLGFPLATPLKLRGDAHANLTRYRKRIRDRWWPDLPPLDAAGSA